MYVNNRYNAEFHYEFPNAYHASVYKHYVDDILGSCEDETLELTKHVIIVQKGGFDICKWLSN